LTKPWERYCLFVLTTKRNPRARIVVTGIAVKNVPGGRVHFFKDDRECVSTS